MFDISLDIHGLGSSVELRNLLFFFLDKLCQMELRCGLAMGQMLPNPQHPQRNQVMKLAQLPASVHMTPFP